MENQWLVLIHKRTGKYSITTREARNIALNDYKVFRLTVPDRVDKTFPTKEEAITYLNRICQAETIINKL